MPIVLSIGTTIICQIHFVLLDSVQNAWQVPKYGAESIGQEHLSAKTNHYFNTAARAIS